MSREFKYGRIALLAGFVLAINPYLLHFGLIAYVFGGILLLLSDKNPSVKARWILIPLMIIGGIYFHYINR